MMRRVLPVLIVILAAGLVLAASAACGGDSDSDASPTPTTASPSDAAPEVGGVEAAKRYLQETGIEGETGALTDPRSCAEITDDTPGDFCVHENFSTYAAGLVILGIGNSDDPAGKVWEMRLSYSDGVWIVTGVKVFGENE